MHFIIDRCKGSVRIIPVLIMITALFSGCAVKDTHSIANLDAKSRWVLLPILNYADAPQAGERVEAILNTLLRSHGISALDKYPAQN